ncbi:MAG: hypothetical protein ACKVIW_13540 [bacterium]
MVDAYYVSQSLEATIAGGRSPKALLRQGAWNLLYEREDPASGISLGPLLDGEMTLEASGEIGNNPKHGLKSSLRD